MVTYAIRHLTQYKYDVKVTFCQNKSLLMPRESPVQRVIRRKVEMDPLPVDAHEMQDYFGNTVLCFSVQEPHQVLTILAESAVECLPRTVPDAKTTPAWESVVDVLRQHEDLDAFDAYQYVFASHYVPIDLNFRRYAESSFLPGRPVLEAVIDLTRRIHEDFRYEPKSTDIATPVGEVLKNRRGVCQDFAHLEIACLRGMGLAARYISGYLRTLPPPGQPRLEGADASHAWLSVFIPGKGWVEVDPTNNMLVSTDHIVLSWGRDFDEVSPIKGIILGGGKQFIHVAVDVIPIEM